VIAVAERLGITQIATLDRRDFTVVRPAHVTAFELPDRAATSDHSGRTGPPGACVAAEDAGSAVKDVTESCVTGGESFTATTKVLLASGAAVPISQLEPGDKVLAANTGTGKTQAETIAAVLVHHDTDLCDLKVAEVRRTAVIGTTSSHFVLGARPRRAWRPVGHGRRRPEIRHPAAHPRRQRRRGRHWRRIPREASGWMWDLTVPGDHDFYIDTVAAPVLVHNCPTMPEMERVGWGLKSDPFHHPVS
jgi:hypothetical protein